MSNAKYYASPSHLDDRCDSVNQLLSFGFFFFFLTIIDPKADGYYHISSVDHDNRIEA